MAKKKFWKETLAGLIIKNVLIATGIVLILLWVTFRFINSYTEHGVEEQVPDVRGAYIEEAELILKAQNLYPEVIDSVYMRDKKLGTIIEQVPAPDSKIKHNRPVYLIINARSIRQISLPAVVDYSHRQAAAMIKAAGLKVESVQYIPSEYKDLVMDVKYKGKSIQAGHKIPEGDGVVLVAGSGLGTEETTIPNLKGFTFDEARRVIMSSSFTVGAAHYDSESTENGESFVIYRQRPVDGTKVPRGTRIDIWLSTDRSLIDKSFDEAEDSIDERFF